MARILLLAVCLPSLACFHREDTQRVPSGGNPPSLSLKRVSPTDEHAYYDGALSPDGSLVAYVKRPNGYHKSRQIWLRSVAGGPAKQLTQVYGTAHRPRFTPDGRHVVYSHCRNEALFEGLWGVNPPLDTREPLAMVSISGGPARIVVQSARLAEFSPDGRRIAFLQQELHPENNPVPRWRLMVMPFPAGSPREVPVPASFHSESHREIYQWAPDSRHLLLPSFLEPQAASASPNDWWIVPVDGGDVVSIGARDLFRAIGQPPAYMILHRDRVLFPRFGRMTGTYEVRWDKRQKRLVGPIRATPLDPRFGLPEISSAGTAVLTTDSHVDFFTIPMDMAKGDVNGPMRRANDQWRSDFGWLRSSLSSFVLYQSSRPDAYLFVLTNVETGEDSGLACEHDGRHFLRPYLSPDGKLVSETLREGSGYAIYLRSTNDMGTRRRLCSECGVAIGFSPDSKYLLLTDHRAAQDREVSKDVYTMNVGTGQGRLWLREDKADVAALGAFGEKWDWIALQLSEANQSAEFLVPWNPKGPPSKSEWVPLPHSSVFSGGSDFVFQVSDGNLRKQLLYRTTRVFGSPEDVANWPERELAPFLYHDFDRHPERREGFSVIVGPGGALAARHAPPSVWTMKVPD